MFVTYPVTFNDRAQVASSQQLGPIVQMIFVLRSKPASAWSIGKPVAREDMSSHFLIVD